MIRLIHLKAFIPLTILLAACAAHSFQPAPTAAPTPSPAPPPTVIPTKTVPPTATSVPGFEDWSVLNPQAVEITTENSSLILTLKHHA
jgi:hypothetical protein